MSDSTALLNASINLLNNLDTNETNKDIAEQNVDFQREVLDYNKQLQQQIFEREDTAFTRAVEDAQKIGINPLSLAGSGGLSAGSVVPVDAPHNDFQKIPFEFNGFKSLADISTALGTASQVSSAINEFKTGNIQRDLLRSEQMKAKLENAVYAYKNGLIVNPDGSISITKDSPLLNREIESADVESKRSSTKGQNITNERNERVNKYQERTLTNDTTPSTVNTASSISDIALQRSKQFDNIGSEQDSLARNYTDEASDKAQDKMWKWVDNYLDKKEKNKDKQPSFFKRYLKYRFGIGN